ncbi:hypothetical protein D3C81_1233370 [compost metagenome]
MQRELPAGLFILLRGDRGGFLRIGGNAGQARLVFYIEGVGVGGVEHVVREGLGKLGLLLLDLGEAGLAVFGQLSAAEAEAAQLVFEQLLARRRQARELGAGGHGLVLLEQREVLAQRRPEFGHAGQVVGVDLAQLGRVRHGAQVAHHAPGAAERLGGGLEGFHCAGPGGRGGRVFGAGHAGLCVGQQHVQRRADVLGTNLGKAGQVGKVEQGIGSAVVVHGHGGSRLASLGLYTFTRAKMRRLRGNFQFDFPIGPIGGRLGPGGQRTTGRLRARRLRGC